MRHFALIGYPLGHSLSERLFTEKFEHEAIDASYKALPIEHVEQIVPHLARLSGFNVTIPHKQAIMPLLASMSDEARAIGAVNCVKVLADGSLVGYNTDVEGIRRSLEGVELCGTKALVLGTGGASKAVCYYLASQGAKVDVVSRKSGAADLTYEDVTAARLGEYSLVVNTTPLGMWPKVDSAPMLPYEALTPQHTLFDCVYNPRLTRFLQEGAKRGARTIDGMTMFLAQAAASWEIWER
ncbi:MAG: shikimate dehydrogenase [Alistipes sp.]|nr:shikimate dehydrogenase [Alistipes sp.]MBR2975463.1 shikimate dehydrogenase [Alistipes sp.]